LQESVANYFNVLVHRSEALLTQSVLGRFLMMSNTINLPYSLRITALKFIANMFHQDALHVIFRSYKVNFVLQLEQCLVQEILTYSEKNARQVLEHITAILLNFAVLWKNPKKDATPPQYYIIARTKVRDLMHMILRAHCDKPDIVLKILIAYGTITKTDARFKPALENIAPFLTHPDPKISTCASYIVQLFNARDYYARWPPVNPNDGTK